MKDKSAIENASEVAIKNIQGERVPALGFGTYRLTGKKGRKAVAEALRVGYRHIDTARMYDNEQEVGQGIADSGVDRGEIFLTSKLWMNDLEPEAVKRETEKSLQLLNVDYLDLMLIHWPNPDVPLEQTLEALQRFQNDGRIKHIGVSNFPPSQFVEAISLAPIFCNQVEYHPFLSQNTLCEIARSNDILLTAYAPLAQGRAVNDPALQEIGKKHGKTAAQVVSRWLIEQDNVSAIPSSSKPQRIASNFEVFDFELDDEDRQRIAELPKDQRFIDPEWAPDWEE